MYEKELKIAELTVQRASLVTKKVSDKDRNGMNKEDDTQVTIGDLAAQALIISALHAAFPGDTFLGEETAKMLREDQNLADRVWNLVSSTQLEDAEATDVLATPKSLKEMMDIIDLGRGQGGRKGRVWVLDPIDGTLTFMRGEQYAVCLCLLEEGVQKVAVLGCPNMSLDSLPISETTISSNGGYLVSAVKGKGLTLRSLSSAGLQPAKPIKPREGPSDTSKLRHIEALLSKSMDHDKTRLVAEQLGISWPGVDIWSQQMKYIAMAVGGHDLMIRIPKNEAYHRTAVWDHAGGHLLAEEAGIKVTDIDGKDIDFGAGRRCFNNIGNIAAPAAVHAQVLKVVQEVRKQ
jgi:3'(2'), 5'-bisphosphate nucleotidase